MKKSYNFAAAIMRGNLRLAGCAGLLPSGKKQGAQAVGNKLHSHGS